MSTFWSSRGSRPWLYDALSVGALVALAVWVFGADAGNLGFYADDVNFLEWLPGRGFTATIEAARAYVPGRELHILWQQLLFLLCGGGPGDLVRLHVAQALLDGSVCGLLFALLRLISLPALAAFAGSVLFLFYPNHGETHFWLSSAAMNIVSTGLLVGYLASVVVALRVDPADRAGHPRLAARSLEGALFVCALFTYDQVVFVAVAAAALRCAVEIARVGWRRWAALASAAFYALVTLAYLLHKEGAGASYGPFLSADSLRRLGANGAAALSLTFGGGLRGAAKASLTASGTEAWEGTLLVVGIVCLGVLVVLVRATAGASQSGPEGADTGARAGRVRLGIALLAAVAGYTLSYLPACLWFISSRHNYLPSVFVCAGAAIVMAWLVLEAGAAGRRVQVVALLVVSLAVAGAAAVGAACGAAEKSAWSDNYRLRSAFYVELGRAGLFQGKKALVLQGFPGYYRGTTFFAYEGADGEAVWYLVPETHGTLVQLAVNASPGVNGMFVHTEQARFGGVNIRYFPAAEVLRVKFVGIDHRRIRWAEARGALADRWRLGLSDGTQNYDRPAPVGEALLASLAFSQDGSGGLRLTKGPELRGAVPAKGEAVGCLLSLDDAGSDASREFSPFVEQQEPHGPNYLVVPLLERRAPAGDGSRQEVEAMTIPLGRPVAAVEVGCYRFGPDPPILLGRRIVPVAR
jgi:hypothetical protein